MTRLRSTCGSSAPSISLFLVLATLAPSLAETRGKLCRPGWLGAKCNFFGNHSFVLDDLKVTWAVDALDSADAMLHMELSHPEPIGWIAIMFGADDMFDGDVVAGGVDPSSGHVVVEDRYSEFWGLPHDDVDVGGSDDLTYKAGAREDGLLRIQFSRKLNTGDLWDVAIPSESIAVGLAAHPEKWQLDFDIHTWTGKAKANFVTGESRLVAAGRRHGAKRK